MKGLIAVWTQEKEDETKVQKFAKMELAEIGAEGEDKETEQEVVDNIKQAQGRSSFLQSRQEYKQKRLEKILKLKEKPSAPTIEELDLKPGYKEIKTRALV